MPRGTDHGAVSLSEFCMPRLTAVRLRGGSGAMPRALMPPNALNRRRQWQLVAVVGSRVASSAETHGHCLHVLQHAEPALHALKTDQTCAQGAVRQHGLRNQRRDAPAAACPLFGRASGSSFARSGAPRSAALVAPRSKTMSAQQLSASLGAL